MVGRYRVYIMKLTVGPLPATVYWRRRAIVFGVLMVVVVLFWTSCSGAPSKSGARSNPAGSVTSKSPSPSPSVQTPTIEVPSTPPTSAAIVSPPPVITGPTGSAIVPCADTELQLTATPETPTSPNGAYLKFVLRIKNVSTKPCTRDLGADHQELYLQNGTTKVWSSDVCNPAHGSTVVTMQPGIEHSYDNTWNGLASNTGCTNRKPPGIGKYELFARLDTMISGPATVQLT